MIRSFIQRLGRRNPDCVFERLDPRCKMIILIAVTIMIIFGNNITSTGLFAVAGVLALLSRLMKLYIFTSLFSILLWCVFMLLFHHALNKPVEDPASMFVGMVFRGTALATTGLWFAVTTKLRDFTAALEAWKIPPVIVLPLTIAIRFIPTLLNESLVIRDSMRLRQIAHRKIDFFKQPHLIGESYLALVTIRSLKMADEIAAVAETRGLARPVRHCLLKPAKFKRNDYCALAILTGLVVVLITISIYVK